MSGWYYFTSRLVSEEISPAHEIKQATYSHVTPSGKIQNKANILADIAGCSFEAVAAAAGEAVAGGGCTSVQRRGPGYSSGCIQGTDCSCYSSSGCCSCPDCIHGCSSGRSSVGRGREYKVRSHDVNYISFNLYGEIKMKDLVVSSLVVRSWPVVASSRLLVTAISTA